MVTTPVPYDKLFELKENLGLTDDELQNLQRHGNVFVRRKDEFASQFQEAFLKLPETKMIIEHEEHPRLLLRAWSHWFETIFGGKVDEKFLEYLWRIGTRHVEVNLDQRFSNLGFSIARQFCQEILFSEVPAPEVGPLAKAVGKLLDLCVLVETTAYIEATTSCDLEVIKGVADRVRTPATIIGGHVKRLQRRGRDGSDTGEIYETLLFENRRLEKMVQDIEMYSDLFERPLEFAICSIEGLLQRALDRVEPKGKLERVRIEFEIDPRASQVKVDSTGASDMFRCLLQNSLDAVGDGDPYIKISTRPVPGPGSRVDVQIFNSGTPPDPEELDQLFSPFYSTKSWGTGFGLSIARLAVRKNFGKLRLMPLPGKGMTVVVTLPDARAGEEAVREKRIYCESGRSGHTVRKFSLNNGLFAPNLRTLCLASPLSRDDPYSRTAS